MAESGIWGHAHETLTRIEPGPGFSLRGSPSRQARALAGENTRDRTARGARLQFLTPSRSRGSHRNLVCHADKGGTPSEESALRRDCQNNSDIDASTIILSMPSARLPTDVPTYLHCGATQPRG
ncbi:hypothetical protein KM043_004079 [Ampulex compressa]|nr:hypothetical protein KM043_004079 [Ampulex compressa]